MSQTTEEKIRDQISSNPIILYMKGVPDAPECGYSAAVVRALKSTNIPFSFVNVLANPFIRERLPKVSEWPTFPQLFVNGELIGGCDIVMELEQSNELLSILESAEQKA